MRPPWKEGEIRLGVDKTIFVGNEGQNRETKNKGKKRKRLRLVGGNKMIL